MITVAILGTGIDIVEVGRFARAGRRWRERFWNRLFTPLERELAVGQRHADQFFAARFAVKEAVWKALGTGLSGGTWQDIEVQRGERGEPVVVLSGLAAERARAGGITKVLVSISHTKEQAIASALAVREP